MRSKKEEEGTPSRFPNGIGQGERHLDFFWGFPQLWSRGDQEFQSGIKRKRPITFKGYGSLKMGLAATYSPTCDRSTIGATGLNFSVRNGKR
jgi:hypothetical protein